MNEVKDETDNKDKPKKKVIFGSVFAKLKKIKHLDIILTVLFIAIILLIYFSTFSTATKNEQTRNSGSYNESTSLQEKTLSAYQKEVEDKLAKTISCIKDAGNVNVFVNFSEGIETKIAYTTETKTNKDGTKVEVKSPVLITNDGKSQTIILQEIMPTPSSIIIVATGARNTNVKLEILRAVQALYNLSSSKIEIFAGN